jgi:hypothetical protein
MSVDVRSLRVMKILVATELTQGTSPDDYHNCIDGELVWVREACDRDKQNRDMPCGCGRGFAGAASPASWTTSSYAARF